jgi:uncharacterized protein with HEPN domain
MRSDRERLRDILEAIEKIETRRCEDKNQFDADEMLQVWTIHYLQIIGEAATRISAELINSHPEVAWGQMIGMRHVLVHGYFEIDRDIVWSAVVTNLPILKRQIETILAHWDTQAE